jgi:hypothetical protein
VAVVIGSMTSSVLMATSIGALGGAPGAQAAAAVPVSHAPLMPAPGPRGLHATTAAPVPLPTFNWSGYAVTGVGFTSASGQWTVPTVTPPAKKREHRFSSTWVGIDGYSNSDLIQAGTEQDWSGGIATYYAWWEILPQFETQIPPTQITVHPGDTMSVSIAQGFPQWTITVSDETTGQSDSIAQSYSGPLTSAEWIQEAPTVGGRIAPLAHDSTVDFTVATANGVDASLSPADSIEMVRHRKVISVPSSPDAAGNGFAVAYGSVPPPPPAI